MSSSRAMMENMTASACCAEASFPCANIAVILSGVAAAMSVLIFALPLRVLGLSLIPVLGAQLNIPFERRYKA